MHFIDVFEAIATNLIDVCEAKGWSVEITTDDYPDRRFLNFEVSRPTKTSMGRYDDTGLIEITFGEDIEIELTNGVSPGLWTLVESLRKLAKTKTGKIEKGTQQQEMNKPKKPDSISLVSAILTRFGRVVGGLQHRARDRSPILVEDEYDVQYVLHAMLSTVFQDVRAEEATPSNSGMSARSDFLIKDHGIFVEAKMTRNGNSDKHICNDLILDIERYESHPDCNALVCFIYDPKRILKNPAGVIMDLEGKKRRMPVSVVIEH